MRQIAIALLVACGDDIEVSPDAAPPTCCEVYYPDSDAIRECTAAISPPCIDGVLVCRELRIPIHIGGCEP